MESDAMKQIAYRYPSKRKLILLIVTLLCMVSPLQAVSEYRINPGDVLQVFVWNEETLSTEAVVQPDGIIRFPIVGAIKAGGNSASQVEAKIVAGLKKYLKDDPVVTASIKSIGGNTIYVLGNVSTPGEFVVGRRVDVMQALALAGGLNSFAAENDVTILRRNGNGENKAIKFPYAKVKHGKNLDKNIVLQSGDTVVVP